MRGRNCIPRVAVHLLSLRIRGNRLTKSFFLFHLASHQIFVSQTLYLATVDFKSILNTIQLVLGLASLFLTHRHVLLQNCLTSLKQSEQDWNARVAQFFEMSDCV